VGECRGELFSCNPKEKIHGNLEIKDVSRLEFSLLAVHFAGANVSFGDVWSELRGIKFIVEIVDWCESTCGFPQKPTTRKCGSKTQLLNNVRSIPNHRRHITFIFKFG